MKKIFMIFLCLIFIFISVLFSIDSINYTKVKDGSKYLSLYEQIIEKTIDKEVINNKEYIAFDNYKFQIFSIKEQKELIDYLNRYNNTIILSSKNTLDDDLFSNADHSLKGIYISCDELERFSNKVKLSISIIDNKDINIKKDISASYYFNKWHLRVL